ncbi:MAG TPA: sialidase family protein [Terriglobales bacterium]|jgi:hypothetical protein
MKFCVNHKHFRLAMLIALALLSPLLLATGCARRQSIVVATLTNPSATGSLCPNQTLTGDGNVLLSWLEPSGDSLALRFAIRRGQGWTTPKTVVVRKNFDKYAEAPPWVLMLPNGTLISVWAEQLPPGKGKWPGNYLLSAVSSDSGQNWSQPVIIHSDRTDGEHSFGSLVSHDEDHAAIVWLDSRDYEVKHTYRLMSAVISSSGSVSSETTVDDDVCTCCPTALISTLQGLMAAYRNHTSEEIRDIYTAREFSGKWQTGQPLKGENWHINGCPVNGPSLAVNQQNVVAVWFSSKEDKPSVQIAFSSNSGATFKTSTTLDSASQEKSVLGKTAVTVLDSGDAIVSWIRRQGGKSEMILSRVRSDGTILSSQMIAEGSSESFGYPRMQHNGSDVLLSWAGSKEAEKINTLLIRNLR